MMERRGIRRWLRLPVRERRRTEDDVDAELSLHVAERIEQLMARGMTEEQARAEADRRLGGVVHARGRLVREAWDRDRHLTAADRIREWRDDVRYALRAVFRERGYAGIVIVTLALGIGANATMFGIVDRLLLSGPAHVAAPHELQRFFVTVQYDPARDASTWGRLHYPALTAFRDGVQSMRDVSGYMTDRRVLGSGVDSRQIDLAAVSASFFGLTGVRPVLGRFFDEGEDAAPQGQHVIVLSWELWQTEFGGDPDVVGRSVDLSSTPHTVVGVAPRGFTGVELTPVQGWTPLSAALARRMRDGWQDNAMSYVMDIAGRLEPGVAPERASAEATAAWRQLYERLDMSPQMRDGLLNAQVTVRGIRSGPAGEEPMEARVSRWLLLVSGIVLLVACANVANLYVARGLRRRREIAVRLSLGVTRVRLLRLLFVESLVLTVMGGAAALVVAYWGSQFVRNVLLPDIEWVTSPLSGRVLLVSAGVTLLVALVTGLAPALQSLNPRLAPALLGSVHSPPAPGRLRGGLAVLQAAFCVVLLVGAGLFVRSLVRVQNMDLGMEAERVLQLQFVWQPQPDLSVEERNARRDVFFTEAVDRLARVPGVEHVSAAIGSPFHNALGGGFRPAGMDSMPQLPGGSYLSAVSPDYFATLATTVLRGRAFGRDDVAASEPVAIVSRSTAAALWPAGDAMDQCLFAHESTTCVRVVGVVADVRRFHLQEEPGMQFYIPLAQREAWMQGPAVLIRTSGNPEHFAEAARRALFELAPTLQHVRAATYLDSLDPQWRPWKMGASLFVVCGVLALVIAVIGLYSVIAYLVLHRTHEIGVRMALGAGRGSIVGMIVRQVLVLAGSGVALGLIVAYAATPYLEPLLFETAARDLLVLGAVALTLVHAALAAGLAPALRASRVPPTQALRD